MKTFYGYTKKLLGALSLLGISIFSNNLFAQLPFYDGFESGNFTAENWTVTGNSEISMEDPFEGTYCVKGPGNYSIEQNFDPIMENQVTIEYAMKASQTNRVCVNQYAKDLNDKISCYVAFRWNGYIVAKDGPEYNSIMDIYPYEPNVWYQIKVVLDIVQKTYDVYIDGELKADDFDYVDNDFSNPTLFRWISGETSGIGWVDDISINSGGPNNNLPFLDCFESGNFTAENWTVTGNSEISMEDPFEGTYCVKGPGNYSIEQNFDPIMENEVTIEYAMKASQTNRVCVNQYAKDLNDKISCYVAFRWNGYIVAKDGPEYDSIKNIHPYSPDVWYQVKVVLNMSQKTYDVYIDDELKADDFDFVDNDFSNPTLFRWISGETSGIGWLDCIEINAENVGINTDFAYQNEVNIYPNPTKGIINIDSKEKFNCEIYSMQGLLVKSFVVSEFSSQVDISNLPKGIYLLNILSQDGKLILSNKIIKE